MLYVDHIKVVLELKYSNMSCGIITFKYISKASDRKGWNLKSNVKQAQLRLGLAFFFYILFRYRNSYL